MAMNKVNTTTDEESFKFLKNQSSILHTVETNKITVNGVNVIVDKPKRGDVMCISSDQKVVWIDGLSIEPTQLSKEFEPVGICLVVKGNKALVRYKEERPFTWAQRARTEIVYSSTMNDGVEHSLKISTSYNKAGDTFVFTSNSREEFVSKLNAWFSSKDTNNQNLYSAQLVELDSDKSAVDKSDNKDNEGNYRNRIVVNIKFSEDDGDWAYFNIDKLSLKDVTTKHIKTVYEYYKNNGFIAQNRGGCCRAKYYDLIQEIQCAPSEKMTSINEATDLNYLLGYYSPVRKVDFANNPYCELLRNTFATYDEYFDSMMIKFPCGAGGAIGEFPSGKENTYKLADGTFLPHPLSLSDQEVLYPAANWAASISLNAPKLDKGNWWLPSAAEMVEIMRDITYDTTFWETNPDIINIVLKKLTSRGFSMLSPNDPRWTSSLFIQDGAWVYESFPFYNESGELEATLVGDLAPAFFHPLYNFLTLAVTIYEF